MEALVKVDHSYPHLTIITLNRPEKRNALNCNLMRDLVRALHQAEKEGQRVVIFQGSMGTFCAGLDLEEAKDESKAEESAGCIAEVFQAIYHSPVVTIAAVQGASLAGGGGIVAACDLAVGGESAIFGFPEVKRGLVAALVSVLLKKLLNVKAVNELLLTGELISSDRACFLGLINRVVSDDKVLEEAIILAKQVLKGSPSALLKTKQLLKGDKGFDFDGEIVKALALHKEMRGSEEAKEGIKAFLEKRPAKWTL